MLNYNYISRRSNEGEMQVLEHQAPRKIYEKYLNFRRSEEEIKEVRES